MAGLLIANGRLVDVVFSSNNINDEGCLLLCDAVRNHPSLQVLHLNRNKLTTVSARSLAEVLVTNRTLRELWLYGNPDIGDEGAICLFEALLVNEHLRVLNVGNCGLTAASVPSLIRLIKDNSTLTKLYLYGNDFGEEGNAAIVDALEHNRVITVFECDLSNELEKRKNAIMERNKALVKVRVESCKASATTLLGIRKLRRAESGLLSTVPRDVLRYVIVPQIWATRERVEWNDARSTKLIKIV